MNKKELVPKLRFPEFTNAWEHHNLDKLFDKGGSGGTPKSTNRDYYNGEIPFLSISDITNSNGFIYNTEKYITNEGLNNCSAWVVPKESISLAMYASVGKVAILKTDLATSQAFYNMVFEDKNMRNFVYQRLKKATDFNEWKKLVSTGTQDNLNAQKVKTFNIKTPTDNKEIEKISSFFDKLDESITLQQRKCNQLIDLKTNLEQTMFADDEFGVPKKRFPEFNDQWERKKLKEVVERVMRKNTNNESSLPLTISAQYGLVDQITFFNKKIASKDMSKYYLLENGEFAYNKSYSAGYPLGVIKRLDKYEKGALSSLYICFKPMNIDSDFLVSYFSTTKWYKQVAQTVSEGARNHGLLNVNVTDFFNTVHLFPTDVTEQKMISKFWKEIDSIIALHQRKLKLLEKRKKALLQQMFV